MLKQERKLFPSRSASTLSGSAKKVSRRILTSNVVPETNKTILKHGDDELDRLVSQHYILRTAFGSDFSAPIELDNNKVVLDVGCGPATWTMEMANAYPDCTFIGIDKHAVFPRDIKPKNCHFQLVDIANAVYLPFPDNSIDYIFQRDMNWSLNKDDWAPLMQEYFRILKPGGWIELMESDLETQGNQNYQQFLNNKLMNAFKLCGHDPYASRRLSCYLASTDFRRIQSQFQSIPLGWSSMKRKENMYYSEYSRAAASQQLYLWQSLQPWLCRASHMSKEKYGYYINQLPKEWKDTRTYINWYRATAQKPIHFKCLH